MINYILILLIVVTYLLNLFLFKRKTKLIEYKDVSFDIFPRIISELTLGINNQILNIKESDNNLILLKKYQYQNKWGIKAIFNLEEKYKNYVINMCNDKMVEYKLHYKIENNSIDFEVNVNNNIEKLLTIIKILFFDLFRLQYNISFTCIFMKRSTLFF